MLQDLRNETSRARELPPFFPILRTPRSRRSKIVPSFRFREIARQIFDERGSSLKIIIGRASLVFRGK